MKYSLPGFREVFPDKRGKRIGRTPFRKCVRCDTANDTRKTVYSNSGSGLKKIADSGATGSLGVYDTAMDEKAGSGCKFCGSLNWSKTKPYKLPDDRNFPATGWKRKRR